MQRQTTGDTVVVPFLDMTAKRISHVHGVEVVLEDLRGHGRGHTELHRSRCVRASGGHLLLRNNRKVARHTPHGAAGKRDARRQR